MIFLLDLEKVSQGMRPVTSADYVIGKSNSFHSDGLFSEVIFGPKDSPERKASYSYINLNCKILHPALVKVVSRMNKKVIEAIDRKKSFKLMDNGYLQEDKNGEINGISAIIENFTNIISRKEENSARQDLKNMLLAYHKKNRVFINKCLIIPAFYREATIDEIQGGLRIQPINDYYQRIIRQSIQLESLSLTEGPMYEILTAKMQFLVNELYDYIIQKVSKKSGLVRQNILGKRADFTGRAVITGAGSKMKVDEIGIPFRILVKLFEPFILYDLYSSNNVDHKRLGELLQEFNNSTLSIPTLRNLFTSIKNGFELPEALSEMIKASVNRAIKDKVVISKRDPALHTESLQGFKPILIDGDTIQINVAKCDSYNADFDGDQMALYVPVTQEAIDEAKRKMIVSESKDSITKVLDNFSKDIVIGIYALTQDSRSLKSPIPVRSDDQLDKMEPLDIIKYDGIVTTVGRVLFNKIMPSKKYYLNEPINKKKVEKLVESIYNEYGTRDKSKYVDFCDKLTKIGMKYYTIMSPSFTLDDLIEPKSTIKLKEQLATTTDSDEAFKITSQMDIELEKHVKANNSNIGVIGQAGGLKQGYSQSRQIIVSKGLISKPDGTVFPVAPSYSDGFTSKQYFKNGYGSRTGIIDRVINTSDTGYLSRQLVYALQRVEADPRIKDCRTTKFLTLKVTDDLAKRLVGRYIIDDNDKIVPFNKKQHFGKIINLRTPLYCQTTKICRTCYGDLLERNKTSYVGILAGEICGERLTQTIMRTFHTGGAVDIKSIDIIQELTRIMSDSDKRYLLKSFEQKDTKLISNEDGSIEILFDEYKDPKKDITVGSDKVSLNYAYFKLNYLNYSTEVTIDNKIEISLKDKKLIRSDNSIVIEFPAKSEVFDCTSTSDIFSEKVKMIDALLSGRTPWRNSDHFFMKVYDVYSTLNTGSDLVHFEILVSNLLRDKGNPSYPARLNKNYDPIVVSLKKIPKHESWLQAFAFEDPKDAITSGLVYDRPTSETILEKLISGKF